MSLDPRLRDRLVQCGAATLANALLKRGLRNTFLLGVEALGVEQTSLAGPAFTLRFIPAREDIDSMALYARTDSLHRRAIEECPPGAVLVMATEGNARASVMGDLMAARLKARGVAGVVTDGGYRDVPGIRRTGLPCFQRATSGPATPIALHPTDLDVPVGCAGVAVYPGDIIVGDGEGVVVIPRHLVNEVCDEAFAAAAYERFAALHIERGRSIFGLFPATPESSVEYEAWVAAGRPPIR